MFSLLPNLLWFFDCLTTEPKTACKKEHNVNKYRRRENVFRNKNIIEFNSIDLNFKKVNILT